MDVRLERLIDIYSYPGAPRSSSSMTRGDWRRIAVDDEGSRPANSSRDEIPWDELAFRSTHEALRDFIDGRKNGAGHSSDQGFSSSRVKGSFWFRLLNFEQLNLENFLNT